jgi:hypothetical protein
MNNSDIQQVVLAEILEELKSINQSVTFQSKALEILHEDQGVFKESLSKVSVKIFPEDLVGIENKLTNGIKRIEEKIANQPREVLHEKRILFYPEGNSENFLKFLFSRLLIITGIVTTLIFIAYQSFYYFKESNNNLVYKKAWIWTFIHQNSESQMFMNETFYGFENDSINDRRTVIIEDFLKKLELKKTIEEMERELESLKANNR